MTNEFWRYRKGVTGGDTEDNNENVTPLKLVTTSHPFAHGQAVGHLIENDALISIGDFAVDLDPAINRAGMYGQTIGLQ